MLPKHQDMPVKIHYWKWNVGDEAFILSIFLPTTYLSLLLFFALSLCLSPVCRILCGGGTRNWLANEPQMKSLFLVPLELEASLARSYFPCFSSPLSDNHTLCHSHTIRRRRDEASRAFLTLRRVASSLHTPLMGISKKVTLQWILLRAGFLLLSWSWVDFRPPASSDKIGAIA